MCTFLSPSSTILCVCSALASVWNSTWKRGTNVGLYGTKTSTFVQCHINTRFLSSAYHTVSDVPSVPCRLSDFLFPTNHALQFLGSLYKFLPYLHSGSLVT
ncbi:hypothetical protein EV424DRAFT_1370644 [Suillus variegatus]|nr:hypothetical protein EV424DRAFT_1370644 [Suillus variegatus]